MNICGLQKLSLLDFPGKLAATVFTGGCNFRCPFCHNASLVMPERQTPLVSEEELFAFLKKRVGKLDGVCVTGGEPTLHADLPGFIGRIRELGFLVKLDTNGAFPDRLSALIEAGLLDYVAMDIKNSREKYALTCGIDGYDTAAVEASVKLLLEGGIPYEFRTTLVAEYHTQDDIGDIARWISGAERYFLQTFADSGDLIAPGLHAVAPEAAESMRKTAARYVKNVGIRGQ